LTSVISVSGGHFYCLLWESNSLAALLPIAPGDSRVFSNTLQPVTSVIDATVNMNPLMPLYKWYLKIC